MKIVFDGKAELIVSLDDFRRDNPARIQNLSTISDAALQPAFDDFIERFQIANETLCSWLVTNVKCTADAELVRLVRGSDSAKGWPDLGDGKLFA